MKKILLTFAFVLVYGTISAQKEKVETKNTDFNRWSIELAGGFNKPAFYQTSGYTYRLISPYTVDLGIRYMFNNKFGIKVDGGYNVLTEKSGTPNIDSRYFRGDVQAVANLGRILNFESWTKSIGLLAHGGAGLGLLTSVNHPNDLSFNVLAGLTGQVKLSNRFVLTADVTPILGVRQHYTYDGMTSYPNTGILSFLVNGTVGITYYLGKNEKHADWIVDNEGKFEAIDAKFMAIDKKLQDTDKDGVADYLDEEANTPAGALVNTKGKSIDSNNNGVSNATEEFIKKYAGNQNPTPTDKELIKRLINDGYVAVYFDFNKSVPTNVSTEGIDFILTYIRNNPSAVVDIIGHADEIGSSAYNDKLSNARAENVKNTLLKANVNASSLNVIAAGEDTSVDVNSENARKLVRRVTFRVK